MADIVMAYIVMVVRRDCLASPFKLPAVTFGLTLLVAGIQAALFLIATRRDKDGTAASVYDGIEQLLYSAKITFAGFQVVICRN